VPEAGDVAALLVDRDQYVGSHAAQGTRERRNLRSLVDVESEERVSRQPFADKVEGPWRRGRAGKGGQQCT
jgi:hypothetical protein